MKGSIKPAHIPVNKYQLIVIGLPDLTPITVSGIEEELQTIDLPDRTKASGGNTGPSECTIAIPLHHTVEYLAMEQWFSDCQGRVAPNYKKNATLIMQSVVAGGPSRTFSLVGTFITKRTLPDLEQANEGEMAAVEYMLSIDQILPS